MTVVKTLILHQTPKTLVRLRIPEPWSGTLFVCFDSAARPRVLEDDGFGEKYLLSQNHAVCAFRCIQNDWYKWVTERVIAETARCLQDLGAAQIIGYGSSMGGYGAIKFSKALGMTRAVVFSLQSDLHHPQDHRWQQVVEKHGPIPALSSEEIDPAIHYEIYFDPRHPLDRLQCDELRPILRNDRAFLAVPYSGHPTTRPLSEAGLLKTTIERVVTARDWHENRRRSAGYFGILSNHASSRSRQQLAATLAEKALALRPEDPAHHFRLGRMLHRLGDAHAARAIAAAERAVALAPENAAYVLTLAETLAVSDPKRAVALATASLQMKPQTRQNQRKAEQLISRCKAQIRNGRLRGA